MKYIIYCGPGIGDFIMTLPMAYYIRQKDSAAYITLFSMMPKGNSFGRREGVALFYEAQNLINNIEYYYSRDLLSSLKWMLKERIKSYKYGFVIQSNNGASTSEWPCRIVHAMAKETAGITFKEKPNIFYDYNIDYMQNKSTYSYMMELLHIVGFKTDKALQKIIYPEKILIFANEAVPVKHRKRICLCIGAAPYSKTIDGRTVKAFAKNWPMGSWVSLANKLNSYKYEVVLVGGADEQRLLSNYVEENLSADVIDCTGKYNIAGSISIISEAEIVVGVDTGMIHCAAALDIPTLTLFGVTSPSQFLAYGDKSNYIFLSVDCSPCYGSNLSVTCKNRKCLNNITVDMVFDKINEILSNRDYIQG